MIIDKSGSENGSGGEEEIDAKTAPDKEVDNPLHEPAGDANPDGGAEAGATPEDGGPKEGEVSEGEELQEPEQPVDPQELIKNLSAQIEELKKKIDQPPLTPKTETQPMQPVQISDQEWEKYESEWGIPRTAIKNTVDRVVKAVTDIRGYIDQRFAKYERQEQLDALAGTPEFADAKKYAADVNKYLEKIDPRFHSNLDVLKDGVIWARGLHYKQSVQKVRNEREINKRISGVARPASPGGTRQASKTPTLTATQKEAADATGMSHEEYASLLSKRASGRIIAQ